MKTKEIKEMTKKERYERLKGLLTAYSELALTDILNGFYPSIDVVRGAETAYNLLKNIDKMNGIEKLGHNDYIHVRVN